MNLLNRNKRAETETVRDIAAKLSHCENPIDRISLDHEMHARLCDALEEIADGLPNNIDSSKCAEVAVLLGAELKVHHLDEEKGLFPLLLKYSGNEPGLAGIIETLALEHEADESFASELVEALDRMAAGDYPDNPDMTGYMLRGFFEGYRRHIAWENAILLPMAKRRLSDNDLETLSKQMASNRAVVHRLGGAPE